MEKTAEHTEEGLSSSQSIVGRDDGYHAAERVQQRPRSPVQSCVSLKSDQSMDPPFHFKHRDSRTLQRSQSWESLKSDWSMEPPFHFKHRVQQRPRSPVQSCVSLKSDQSMDPPFHFKHRIVQRPLSCESLKSDWSMEAGPVSFTCGQTSNQSDQQRSEVTCPTDQGSVLALLEEKMVAFVKKELKFFFQAPQSRLPRLFIRVQR
ncbi:uncharacterized protein LOC115439239 isoform X2 [Sphaeramia orbicularis]|uniref:uncharacterized protein LOC115439239 isoform X2 n=1 Tax=Sphaeramia orbicularis TaxID=375764 RepID=UPI001180B1F8|nr:uncharacterized protein LOC115439239 isoform X2 [Sphaeramia orbicularis]